MQEGGLVYVEVEANVIKPEKLSVATTNTFVFVFSLAPSAEGSKPVRRVLPTCDEEAERAWKCRASALEGVAHVG